MTQQPSDGKGPPPIDRLKTGDLLFPRPKDGWVPYFRLTGGNPPNVEDRPIAWSAIQSGVPYAKYAPMSPAEFNRRYWGDDSAANLGSGFYTGHVAIFDNGNVIEALWGDIDKVVMGPYEAWKISRQTHYVWVSRLKETGDRCAAFVAEARKQVGKPYKFLDFDLNDPSGFYCSKLAWFAAFRALKIAMDDDKNPIRNFWYSPKQLLHSPHLEPIQSAGNYAL